MEQVLEIGEPVIGRDEYLVLMLDLVAWLKAQYQIVPVRYGRMWSRRDPHKLLTWFVFKRSDRLIEGVREFDFPSSEETRKIKEFISAQREYRQFKTAMERPVAKEPDGV